MPWPELGRLGPCDHGPQPGRRRRSVGGATAAGALPTGDLLGDLPARRADEPTPCGGHRAALHVVRLREGPHPEADARHAGAPARRDGEQQTVCLLSRGSILFLSHLPHGGGAVLRVRECGCGRLGLDDDRAGDVYRRGCWGSVGDVQC